MGDFALTGTAYFADTTNTAESGPAYFIDAPVPQRPKSAFQRRNEGGGGGAGGGRGGLGGRHAAKNVSDILPRSYHTIAHQASRHVASKPPQSARPRAHAFEERKAAPTNFRRMYERGDMPLRIAGGVHKFVRWHVGEVPKGSSKVAPSFHAAGGPEYEEAKARFLAQLDYTVWLPLVFEGIREQTDPCRFLAVTAIKDLLDAGTYEKVAPVVPLLVMPLREALNTREPNTVRRAIDAMRLLVRVPADPASGARVGEALAPYFRHFLPMFNLFKSNASFASSYGDYSTSLGEVMDETMHLLAEQGGPGAAQEINRIVPLWVPPPARTRRPFKALLTPGV